MGLGFPFLRGTTDSSLCRLLTIVNEVCSPRPLRTEACVTSQLPPIGADSRRHRVAQALREAITTGQYQPGDRLVELDLAAQLGTSRGPVREALRQLENEGLVMSFPYRGTEVLGVAQEEIDHVLVPIRLTIERFAFARALPLLTDDDLAQLGALVERMRGASGPGATDEMAEADIRFHELVIEASGQRHCLQVWRTIQSRVQAYFRRDAPAHRSHDEVADQHQRLLEAVASRDEARVVDELERHILAYLHQPADAGAGAGAQPAG
jgi:DNA-binding GntR family transcriptional regulator